LQSLIHDALEQHARATTQHLFSAETLQAILRGAANPFPTLRAWSLHGSPREAGGTYGGGQM
jgi:hypothetical protein